MSTNPSSSSVSPAVPKQKDLNCASLARDALFPLKVQRDGHSASAQQLFPASEALAKVRDVAIRQQPDRAASSFFPRGIIVVHDIHSHDPSERLKWNGQPDISINDASIDVIPKLLSVRCRLCGKDDDGTGPRDAYIVQDRPPDSSGSGGGSSDNRHRELVLCSDRLMKKNKGCDLAGVETALAHHVTKFGEELKREEDGTSASVTSCQELAAMEIRAARAAECYYGQAAGTGDVKRGPALGHVGYSWYPQFIREMLRDRCVRSVANHATSQEYGDREGRQCVNEVFSEANQSS